MPHRLCLAFKRTELSASHHGARSTEVPHAVAGAEAEAEAVASLSGSYLEDGMSRGVTMISLDVDFSKIHLRGAAVCPSLESDFGADVWAAPEKLKVVDRKSLILS